LCLLRADRHSIELSGVNPRDPEWMSIGMSKTPAPRAAELNLSHPSLDRPPRATDFFS
jgi:hypothetical protein